MSLVLNRNVGQEVVIGDELIVVRINKVNKGQVTLGLEAPSQISVHRREIFEKNKALKVERDLSKYLTKEDYEIENYFQQIKNYFGSYARLSQALNVSRSAIYKWRYYGRIPRRHSDKIEELTLGMITIPLARNMSWG